MNRFLNSLQNTFSSPEKVSRSDYHETVDKILNQLLEKIGDSNVRTRDLATQCFIAASDNVNIGLQKTFSVLLNGSIKGKLATGKFLS